MGGLSSLASGIGGAIGGFVGGITGAEDVSAAARQASADTLTAAREARELNIERYGEAKDLLTPYIEDARTAQDQLLIEMGLAEGTPGTAYMETPAYQALLEERQKGVEQSAANTGSLYSGTRLKAAADVSGATQSQFYQNYMSMLQSLASPATATNLASLGVGQGATLGQNQQQAQQVASSYMLSAAQTNQAAMADFLQGVSGTASGAFAGGYI